jgi:multiple sugar transport system permease protein
MSDRTLIILFILPTIIILILMNVYPLFSSLYLSFTEYSVIGKEAPAWIGLENYQEVLSDEGVWDNFVITGRYALFSVGLQMIVGFGLALLVNEKFKGSGLFTTLLLIPMMLSPVVVGVFWRVMFNPSYGIFNYLIGQTDAATAPDWLYEQDLALWAIIIVDVWMWSPFVMLLALSGLKAIPNYLYEAAAIDRAGYWFQFRRITLPRVMPLLLIALLFRTIEALKQFDLVMALTAGGNQTTTVATRLYFLAFNKESFQTGFSSALAYIVLVITIAISSLYIRALNRVREG